MVSRGGGTTQEMGPRRSPDVGMQNRGAGSVIIEDLGYVLQSPPTSSRGSCSGCSHTLLWAVCGTFRKVFLGLGSQAHGAPL